MKLVRYVKYSILLALLARGLYVFVWTALQPLLLLFLLLILSLAAR